jgi:hypothetical protein
MGDSSMTDILDTIRQAEAAGKAARMSKPEKFAYLKSNGWQRADGNRWRRRDGMYASFATAVLSQLLAEREVS